MGTPVTRIAGYIYWADIYCPECIIEIMIARGDASPAARDMPPETVLDQCAGAMGIDRYDEATYDTDEFPKVAFVFHIVDGDTCGRCLQPIL